ncbi:hypothetical protein [Rhizobium sp. No.120]
MRKHESKELLRKRQQGHGRPVITVEHMGFRFVAVGKRFMYSSAWRYFNDFLIDNMKHVMGVEWGKNALQTMPNHPVLRWLGRLGADINAAGSGKGIPLRGYSSALARFCYALYLIEHNDAPPRSLVKRLQKPIDFDPACYEAIVAAAFAVAGAKIVGAEDSKGNGAKPEFFATFGPNQQYSVEAKRKRSWKTEINFDSDAFISELRSWLRDKLHAASKKKLRNPVYWFELGIGKQFGYDDAEKLQKLVGEAILEAETMTVDGKEPPPAYVVVTNNVDLANDDATEVPFFALLQGFRMQDFRGDTIDIEVAMERHDKHRPIRRVLNCFNEVQRFPTSFDGVPDELLDPSGMPIKIPQIGDHLEYADQDGAPAVGQITEIISMGQEAIAVISDDRTAAQVLIKIPLSDQEMKAAAVLGNAIFGKPEGPQGDASGPLGFYDRALEMYRDFDRSQLLNQLGNHPQKAEFEKLSRDELLARVAREVTKMVVSLSDEGALRRLRTETPRPED